MTDTLAARLREIEARLTKIRLPDNALLLADGRSAVMWSDEWQRLDVAVCDMMNHAPEDIAFLLAECRAAADRLDAQQAQLAELRQRDKVISHQLERVADGFDPLTKDLRNRLENATQRIAALEQALGDIEQTALQHELFGDLALDMIAASAKRALLTSPGAPPLEK